MVLFEKCHLCGGEMVRKKVEKVLKGGVHTASINVEADVCLHCGERLYTVETIRKFEQIRKKLKQNNLEGLVEIGKALQVI